MTDVKAVVEAAIQLNGQDDVSLVQLVGMREKAIENNPALAGNIDFETKYDSGTMGGLDEIRALGKRILARWNKELHGVVCGGGTEDEKSRKAILDSLNLGEAAVIAAVVSLLLSLGAAAAIAAVLAPLIVRRFIWPAKDELCAAWSEGIKAEG